MKTRRNIRFALLTVTVLLPCPAPASGPFEYDTPFFDERNLENMLAGHLTDRFGRMTLSPLISYLHLTGQFTPGHAALFRYEQRERLSNKYSSAWRHESHFRSLLETEGYPRIYFENWKSITRTRLKDGQEIVTRRSILNCAPDAFRVAGNSLQNRKSRYGSGSPKLRRWIDAQVKVFSHCGNEPFDPPAEPQDDWSTLERHDRQYQIAASYFYAGQYLEAARRFEAIGATPASPWSGLSRYLAGRSLTREARVNESKRDEYLRQVLSEYRLLAEDHRYVAAFPWILNQVRGMEAELDPVPVLNELESKIIGSPGIVSLEDVRDFLSLDSSHYNKRRGASDYADWRLAGMAEIVQRWRENKSLEWLFLALITVDSSVGEQNLRELLDAAGKLGAETPGFHVMVEHRVRILALLNETEAALALADQLFLVDIDPSASLEHNSEAALWIAKQIYLATPPQNLGYINRVRMRAAIVSGNWKDYFRFSSLLPLELPWSDHYVRSLPDERFNHITSETTLFPRKITGLINNYFTPRMMLEAISYGGLSNYQRGRLAISAWTKAILMDDLETARQLSGQLKRFVPRLKTAFETFEQAPDPRFEAALIVLDNPAFSPSMWHGAGRQREWTDPVQPAPDYVALPWNRYNWWCWRDIEYTQRKRVLSGPRFAHYDESQLEEIRRVTEIGQISAAGFFGPHVIRFARSHSDDPRVPRALHRVVFATQYACMGGPGEVSREAHQLLHKHFPDSEWTKKTPYWFD